MSLRGPRLVVRPLRIDDAIFEAMLEGWARQQRSRMLREATILPPRLECVMRPR